MEWKKSSFRGILLGMVLLPYGAHSQVVSKINGDPRIEQVLQLRIAYNRRNYFSDAGYRIQLYQGAARQDAYSAQTDFKKSHPEMVTYLTYAFPNFKVMGGDFKTKEEAFKVMTDFQKDRPFLMQVIPQKIDVTKIRDAANE